MDYTTVRKNEPTAVRRYMYFHLVDATDGFTPELGEATGQPQISINGAAFADAGIGTLVSIGTGDYYAEVTQATLNVDQAIVRGRYKSAATREARAEQALVVGDFLGLISNALIGKVRVDFAGGNAGRMRIFDTDGTTLLWTRTPTTNDGDETTDYITS